jgi:hypothetical protein
VIGVIHYRDLMRKFHNFFFINIIIQGNLRVSRLISSIKHRICNKKRMSMEKRYSIVSFFSFSKLPSFLIKIFKRIYFYSYRT